MKRANRVTIICQQCGTPREYRESEVRKRGEIKYCSIRCRGLGHRKPESKTRVKCDTCGKEFTKRTDHVWDNNYCSKACAGMAKRVEGARWRDPEQIREYMREYQKKNRGRINAHHREYNRKNRDQRNAIQRSRRDAIKFGSFTDDEWEEMKEACGRVCLSCGKYDDNLVQDHIVSIADGGKHERGNIQPLCFECNRKKGRRTTDYRT